MRLASDDVEVQSQTRLDLTEAELLEAAVTFQWKRVNTEPTAV
jgi:hypothetical protein